MSCRVASGNLAIPCNQDLTLGLPLAQGHQEVVWDKDGTERDSNWSPEFICPPPCACTTCGRAGPCWSAGFSSRSSWRGSCQGRLGGLLGCFQLDQHHTGLSITPWGPPSTQRKYAGSNSAQLIFRIFFATNQFQDYESRRLVMNAACTDEPAVIGES